MDLLVLYRTVCLHYLVLLKSNNCFRIFIKFNVINDAPTGQKSSL